MRFWDTSAIVPLLLQEPASGLARGLAQSDSGLVVWWATRTEALSALARRRRDGQLDERTEDSARQALEALSRSWSEVLPSEAVRQRAERLLRVHDLRAANAFQLAAALLWSHSATASQPLVSLDERLRVGARLEGFAVLPE